MSTILHIETSTDVCSVAVSEDSHVIFEQQDHSGPNHAERLGTMVDEALSFTDNHAIPFDAVAVSSGPGSYTGLRIGVSTAKGVCYAADVPLMAIDTLEAMAHGMKEKLGGQIAENDLLIPMIDARRMEVYAAIFDANLNKVEDTAAMVIDEHSFENLSKDHHLWLFGDGAPKLNKVFENQPNISVIDGFKPSAAFMRPLAEKALRDKDFVDVAYFEPFYLKDFIAGKPHVKGLG